jgi:hypothetical protein
VRQRQLVVLLSLRPEASEYKSQLELDASQAFPVYVEAKTQLTIDWMRRVHASRPGSTCPFGGDAAHQRYP